MNKTFFLILLCFIPFSCGGNGIKTVLIICDSQTKHTWKLAEAIAEGASSVPYTIVLLQTPEGAQTKDLVGADAIIVGSPVHKGNPTPAILAHLATWPINGELENKVGAAFVSAGGIGAGLEDTLFGIIRAMLLTQMIIVGGTDWRSAFGAYLVTDHAPFNESAKYEVTFLQLGSKLGERVARLLHQKDN